MLIKRLPIILIILAFFNVGHAQNWEQITSGTSNNLNASFFINPNVGWVVGDNGTILKSVDNGEHWTIQTSNTSANLYGLYFINEQIGYAVGSCRTILKTTNGGSNWEIIYDYCFDNNLPYYDVYMQNENTGVAMGASGLGTFYTTTGFTTGTSAENLGIGVTKIQPISNYRIFICFNDIFKISDNLGRS